jgi:hypothetical protein
VGVGRAQAIERETTRKTGDRPEQTLKCLRQVMRDEVLVDLHHGDNGLFGVSQTVTRACFTLNNDELLVGMDHSEPLLAKTVDTQARQSNNTYAEINLFTDIGSTTISASSLSPNDWKLSGSESWLGSAPRMSSTIRGVGLSFPEPTIIPSQMQLAFVIVLHLSKGVSDSPEEASPSV